MIIPLWVVLDISFCSKYRIKSYINKCFCMHMSLLRKSVLFVCDTIIDCLPAGTELFLELQVMHAHYNLCSKFYFLPWSKIDCMEVCGLF